MAFRPAFLLAALIALGSAAQADDPPLPQINAVALASSLPAPVLKRLRRYPVAFIKTAADAILTYGAKTGLAAAGVERLIALDRAKVRAAEVERLMRADLDNDGVIARAEFDGLLAVTSEGFRGRLELAWRQADADRSGKVDAPELAAHARTVALAEVSDADADGWRAIVKFDLDDSGFVEIDEVIAAVAVLQKVDITLILKEI